MSTPTNLTSGRLLARNTLLNFVGEAAPLAVAFVSVPLMIRGLGVDRYGVMTLVMIAVGYFSLFDFGLGRAATRLIADAAAAGDDAQVPGIFWTSLYLMFAFGIVAALIVAILAPWLVTHVLKIPGALRAESLTAFYLLALSTPFALSGSSCNAILSAYQRFDLINALRVPMNIFWYLGPLAILPFSNHLGAVVAILVAGRVAGWAIGMYVCLRVVPSIRRDLRPRRVRIRQMMTFGGWLTISGIVHPIMNGFEKFIVGAMLSTAAVTYYSVPAQLVSKLGIIPTALNAVIFAALSATASQDPPRAAILFERANRYVLLALFPVVLLLVSFAPEILTLWLGASFSEHSATAMRWLAVGMFINCLSWVPATLLLSVNRPETHAAVHLAEAPFFVVILWLAVSRFGTTGAAFASALRSAVDTLVFFGLSRRYVSLTASGIRHVFGLASCALFAVALSALPMEFHVKVLFLASILTMFGIAVWRMLLDGEERALLLSQMRTVLLPAFGAGQ